MKFLGFLEKAWLAAIVIAFSLGFFNAITSAGVGYRVYTPIVCGCFCILIYMNIKRQRLFLEKMKKDHEKDQAPTA